MAFYNYDDDKYVNTGSVMKYEVITEGDYFYALLDKGKGDTIRGKNNSTKSTLVSALGSAFTETLIDTDTYICIANAVACRVVSGKGDGTYAARFYFAQGEYFDTQDYASSTLLHAWLDAKISTMTAVNSTLYVLESAIIEIRKILVVAGDCYAQIFTGYQFFESDHAAEGTIDSLITTLTT